MRGRREDHHASADPRPRGAEIGDALPKLEIAATLVLGGCAAAFASLQLGLVIWAVGLLLSLNQLRTTQRVQSELSSVKKLAQIVDLKARCDIEELKELIDAYTAVPEPEFLALKEVIVTGARDELGRLRSEKRSGELATGSYYRWLLPMLDAAVGGHHVRALSLMMSCEWDDSPPERRYIEANVRAAERGVLIDRIFVMRAEDLVQARSNPAVQKHFSDQGPKHLRGHFVDAARLAQRDSALDARLGHGFIAFDERVALIDLQSTDGSARGFVSMKAAVLRGLGATFEELLVHSQPLTPELLSETLT